MMFLHNIHIHDDIHKSRSAHIMVLFSAIVHSKARHKAVAVESMWCQGSTPCSTW